MILTIGMWAHVIVNAIVCFAPTRNPIWGELRLIGVIATTIALWVGVAVALGH